MVEVKCGKCFTKFNSDDLESLMTKDLIDGIQHEQISCDCPVCKERKIYTKVKGKIKLTNSDGEQVESKVEEFTHIASIQADVEAKLKATKVKVS
jgi:hypothetical protein